MVVQRNSYRLIKILAIATAILMLPLIAMNFTEEVNWGLFDFLVAGILLFGTGLTLEFIMRKIKSFKYRLLLGTSLFLLLILLWAELAVGIFGSPIAGN
jgi:hypothetical protein